MTFKEAELRLNIEVDLLPASARNRTKRSMSPSHITIHNTANPTPGADARMHSRYMRGSDAARRMVSWHYTVDDKRCVKSLPLSEQGIHAGTRDGNRRSIGIEICMHSGIDQAAADDRAALLVALLVHRLNIPPKNIVPHQFWSGKLCPVLLLAEDGVGWHKFLTRVAEHLQGLTNEPVGLVAPSGQPEGLLPKLTAAGQTFIVNARPDTPDFRDQIFVPTLIDVPIHRSLEEYRAVPVPILNQGQEGACTGFGLATVAHYLLMTRGVIASTDRVSPRMLYEMARRYDEWPGEQYSGSSARGAMKGWFKHGVCAEPLWPYSPGGSGGTLTTERVVDAAERPLGAYFRVNHKDLVAMHAAIAEVGILYATCVVHRGWQAVGPDGEISYGESSRIGGHAFAIVGYDRYGLWIQNSWGRDWGRGGFARISYDDWLDNGSDVWVARLGVPLRRLDLVAAGQSRAGSAHIVETYAAESLRPHIISLGNDGQLKPDGSYGTDEAALRAVFQGFKERTKAWTKKRILLYAHGGLVPESAAVQTVAKNFEPLLANEVYPIAFIWNTDLLTTFKNILTEAVRRRSPETPVGGTFDFLEDRWDDLLEPLTRAIGGKDVWDEIKENATLASQADMGGARMAAILLDDLALADDSVEIHMVGHSAGAVFHAPLAQFLATSGMINNGPLRGSRGLGQRIATCTLWAPACRTELFKSTYLPLIKNGRIGKFASFVLSDRLEQDDNCVGIYRKSLLFLVSNACENPYRIPLIHPDGAALLGMERFINADPELKQLFASKRSDLVISGKGNQSDPKDRCTSTSHGGFDDDLATRLATLDRILSYSASQA